MFFKPLFFDKFNLKYSKIQNLILRREIFVYDLTKNTFFLVKFKGRWLSFSLNKRFVKENGRNGGRNPFPSNPFGFHQILTVDAWMYEYESRQQRDLEKGNLFTLLACVLP